MRQYIARCSAVVVKILRAAGLRSVGVGSGRFVGSGSRGADAVAAPSNHQINHSCIIAIRVQNAVQILIESRIYMVKPSRPWTLNTIS